MASPTTGGGDNEGKGGERDGEGELGRQEAGRS